MFGERSRSTAPGSEGRDTVTLTPRLKLRGSGLPILDCPGRSDTSRSVQDSDEFSSSQAVSKTSSQSVSPSLEVK